MAQIIWTEPALNDLDAIADYMRAERLLRPEFLAEREDAAGGK